MVSLNLNLKFANHLLIIYDTICNFLYGIEAEIKTCVEKSGHSTFFAVNVHPIKLKFNMIPFQN